MSLKSTIIEYLRGKDLVHKGELGRKAVLDWGYENENIGRRCRELENEGILECQLIKNKNTHISEAWYRLKSSNSAPQDEIKAKVDSWAAQFKKEPINQFTLPPTLF